MKNLEEFIVYCAAIGVDVAHVCESPHAYYCTTHTAPTEAIKACFTQCARKDLAATQYALRLSKLDIDNPAMKEAAIKAAKEKALINLHKPTTFINPTTLTGSIFIQGVGDEVYEIYQLDSEQQQHVPQGCKFSVRSNKGYDQYANGRTPFKKIERAIAEVNHRITIDRIEDQ